MPYCCIARSSRSLSRLFFVVLGWRLCLWRCVCRAEAKTMDRMHESLGGHFTRIHLPQSRLSTKRVLIMSYLEVRPSRTYDLELLYYSQLCEGTNEQFVLPVTTDLRHRQNIWYICRDQCWGCLQFFCDRPARKYPPSKPASTPPPWNETPLKRTKTRGSFFDTTALLSTFHATVCTIACAFVCYIEDRESPLPS